MSRSSYSVEAWACSAVPQTHPAAHSTHAAHPPQSPHCVQLPNRISGGADAPGRRRTPWYTMDCSWVWERLAPEGLPAGTPLPPGPLPQYSPQVRGWQGTFACMFSCGCARASMWEAGTGYRSTWTHGMCHLLPGWVGVVASHHLARVGWPKQLHVLIQPTCSVQGPVRLPVAVLTAPNSWAAMLQVVELPRVSVCTVYPCSSGATCRSSS